MPNITQFKSRLNGGVRPNLYEVEINFPTGIGGNGGSDDQKVSLSSQGRYLCRSTSLPTHSQGLIEVPFRGRFLKIPGDRTFEAWTATFYNTSDFNLRAAFEQWINLGNQVDENIGVVGGLDAIFKDVTLDNYLKILQVHLGTLALIRIKFLELTNYLMHGQLQLVQLMLHLIVTML